MLQSPWLLDGRLLEGTPEWRSRGRRSRGRDLHPGPGRASGSEPAGTMTRKARQLRGRGAPCCAARGGTLGLVATRTLCKCRGGAPGGERPTLLGARRLVRCLLRAAFGTLRCGVPHQRLPAPHPPPCARERKGSATRCASRPENRPTGQRSVGFVAVVARMKRRPLEAGATSGRCRRGL